MPIATLDGPRIAELEARRRLVKAVSAAMAEAYALPLTAIIVLIKENQPENVGVGGELLADRRAAKS
jgi:4-oxalocrotonate tautomerase